MKRALTVISIIALLLGIALIASPYWLGMQTEAAFSSAIKSLAGGGRVSSKNNSFVRGWIESSANSEFPLSGSPIVINASHKIEHGPLPLSRLLSGELLPALAIIKTTMRLGPAANAPANLIKILETLPALELETILDLSGNGVTHLKVGAATRNQGEASVNWQEGEGQILFDRDWKRIKFDFHLPLLTIDSARGTIVVKDARLSSDMTEGVAGYMFGRNSLSVARITMDPFMDIQNIRLSAFAQSKGKFVTLNFSYGVESLHIVKDKYGPGKINIAIRNLDTKTLGQFEQDINKITSRDLPKEQSQLMIAGKTLELAGKLSRFNPELEITRLSFTAPGGDLTGKAQFVLQGKDVDLSANPMLFLTALKGAAELSIPNSLAKALVMPQIQRDISNLGNEGKLNTEESAKLNADTLSQIAEEVYPKYLQASGFGRWFVKQENKYQFSMSVDRGQITINGAPLSQLQ